MHTSTVPCSHLLSSYSASESVSGAPGDYYEIVRPHAKQLLAGMGNLSLEGPAGPILMRGLQAHLRSLLSRGLAVSYCAGELNRMLWNVAPDHTFSALFLVHIDPDAGWIHYLNAGHEAALLVRASGAVERLEPHAPILGLSRRSEYRERCVRFAAGDALIVVSEGAGEAAERILSTGIWEISRDLPSKIVDASSREQDCTAILIHSTLQAFAMVA